jgi:ribosome biogenesis GTPase A
MMGFRPLFFCQTKHFQTLFWTPNVRLVDCPGLVMPNFVDMEMQVLSGILPISRVSAVPACIYYVSHYLPLEEIFKLVHPLTRDPPKQDKRTWREDRQQLPLKQEDHVWTAMDILVAYASAKNWVTAKAGRPDVNRAGNASKFYEPFFRAALISVSSPSCIGRGKD